MSKNDDDLRPSWVPEEPNPEFACSVVRGIDSAVNSVTGAKEYPDAVHLRKVPLRKKMSIEEYVEGVAKGDRMILSKAITLIESNAPKDFDKAQRVLQALLPRTGPCAPCRGSPVCPGQARVVSSNLLVQCFASKATKWRRWQSTQQALLPADPS